MKEVKKLPLSNVPGSDAILVKINKAGGQPMAKQLQSFHCKWRKEAIPKESKDACIFHRYKWKGNLQVQYNLNGSNPDGSFTLDDSNSFFSPYKILPIAQENKYLGIFFLILSWNCMLCVFIRIASLRRF